MSNLEYIVRPFQTKVISLPTTIELESEDAAAVEVRLVAKGNAVTYPFSFAVNSAPSDTLREISRTTKKVKIENPDDPTQFVEVERATKIELRDENDPQRVAVRHYKADPSSS